jgi:SAM-dependent methyltransferase
LVHGQRWTDNQGVYDKSRGPHIIATVGVQEYRKTIPFTVKAGDCVLEVGCHLGTSSVLLQEAAAQGDAGYCIGVDVGPKIIQGAKERYPGVYFSVGDARKTAALLRVQQDFNACHEQKSKRLGFDVIYVDVGGLSGSDGLLESLSLLSSLMNALEPQYIVIKSLCMRRLASTLVPYWRVK